MMHGPMNIKRTAIL